jgi:exopolysaccharide biosynthesis predicted pyruvyltransferase EpsI
VDHLAHLRADIEAFLEGYRGQKVLFFPNPGNAGDALIAEGTYQALTRAHVSFDVIDLHDEVTDQIVFIGGGGNLNSLYSDIKQAFERFSGRARQIVLLPHTIRGNVDVLKSLDARCILFCRDRESFDHVRSTNPSVDCRMAHDMAFHLDIAELLRKSPADKSRARLLRRRLFSIGYSQAKLRAMQGVDMLRLDRESSHSRPASDMDISDLFAMGVTPDIAPTSAWCFLKTIDLAQHVNTDRLHVGIGSALLGKPCTLQNNSYGKNRAVFDFSLRDFACIDFIGPVGRRYDRRNARLTARIAHRLPILIRRGITKVWSARRAFA